MRAIKWKRISDHRDELFGLAIVTVIVLHYWNLVLRADYIHSHVFKTLAVLYTKCIGSVGVDIFLFLSGFGICYSLQKRPNIRSFYLKRITRVLFPYLILGGVFWLIKDLLLQRTSVSIFVYDYLQLSFWGEGNLTFWYISFICCLYFISPLVYAFKKKGITAAFIASFLVAVALYYVSPETLHKTSIAIERMPVYFVGMYCAFLAGDGKMVRVTSFAVMTVISLLLKAIAGYMDFIFSRWANILYASVWIFAWIYLSDMQKKKVFSKIDHGLAVIGHYSLELYISHVAVMEIMDTLDMRPALPWMYGLCVVISVFVSVGFSKTYDRALKCVSKRTMQQT